MIYIYIYVAAWPNCGMVWSLWFTWAGYGAAMDMEGVVLERGSGREIHLVQARPIVGWELPIRPCQQLQTAAAIDFWLASQLLARCDDACRWGDAQCPFESFNLLNRLSWWRSKQCLLCLQNCVSCCGCLPLPILPCARCGFAIRKRVKVKQATNETHDELRSC